MSTILAHAKESSLKMANI